VQEKRNKHFLIVSQNNFAGGLKGREKNTGGGRRPWVKRMKDGSQVVQNSGKQSNGRFSKE